MSYKLLRANFYPMSRGYSEDFKHKAIIGVGSNDGKTRLILTKLIRVLMSSREVRVVKSSPLFKNPPFGYIEQNEFHNAVLEVQTSLTPKELLRYMLQVERNFRRVRGFKHGPRTLDLDLLFFDDVCMKTKDLVIPHPYWSQRISVLLPLRFVI